MTTENAKAATVPASTGLSTPKKAIVANLSWSLDVGCPKCGEGIDLALHDTDDMSVARRIFTNEWSKLRGHEIVCPSCAHEFLLDGVEY